MVDHYAKLNNYIDRNSDYVTGLLQDMIRIPTVNPKFEVAPERNKEAEHQDFLEGELKSLGFLTEQSEPFENRPNLVGVWSGNEERSLLLGGHVDVVPEGNINKWTVDPYGGEIRDGRLFGRGALDMKGGLAACVMAVKAVKECGFELAGQVEIHAVVDEEAGGFGSRALANTRKVPAAGIITEPTWHSINPAEGGLVFMRVTIPGKNSHAAWRYNSIYPQHHVPDRPEPGVNAIELGTRFLAALRELEREWAMRKYHPLMPLGITTMNPGVAIGGTGVDATGRPAILTNPAMIPDNFIVDFHFKFLPNEDYSEVKKEFEDFVHHWAQTIDFLRENPPLVQWELGGVYFPPFDTDPHHGLVRSLVRSTERLGRMPEVKGFTACSDGANYAAQGMSAVVYGPSGDGMHGYDEYVDIASMIECSKVIAAAVVDWCGNTSD